MEMTHKRVRCVARAQHLRICNDGNQNWDENIRKSVFDVKPGLRYSSYLKWITYARNPREFLTTVFTFMCIIILRKGLGQKNQQLSPAKKKMLLFLRLLPTFFPF